MAYWLSVHLPIQETKVLSLGRKIPWSRKWQPTPVFLPGKSHGQWSLMGYSPWGCKESDTTKHAGTHWLYMDRDDSCRDHLEGLAICCMSGILGKSKIQDECNYVFSISRICRQETKKLYTKSQNTIVCLFFFFSYNPLVLGTWKGYVRRFSLSPMDLVYANGS